MDKNLRDRLAMGVLVFALILALDWLLSGNQEASPPQANTSPQTESTAPADLESTEPELVRTKFAELSKTDSDSFAENSSTSEASVLVQLTTKKGESGHAPAGCEGWPVTVYYRNESQGETATKSAFVDGTGRVSIALDSYVQVERIICIPPANSGFGFALHQASYEFSAHEQQKVLLHVTTAQTAFGKVVDHHGEAVPHASVHVFPRNQNPGLNDWHDGIVTTSTDGAGNFRFAQMPPGAWTFAVQPTQWLMYSPGLEEQSEGHGLLFFYEGDHDTSNAGTLEVVPMSVVELKVTSSNELPVGHVIVGLSPIQFEDPNVKGSEEDDFSSLQDILLPYDSYFFETNQDGAATLRLANGKWKLKIFDFPGMHTLGLEHPSLEFSTHDENLAYQIQAPFTSLDGKFLTPKGEPIFNARISLASGKISIAAVTSKGDGSFSFSAFPLKSDYQLSAFPESQDWLPSTEQFHQGALGQVLEIRAVPSSKIRFKVRDLQGKPLIQAGLHLRVMKWHPQNASDERSFASAWTKTRGMTRGITDSGVQEIRGLMPGRYELALFHKSDRLDPITGSRPEAVEVRRWTLDTGEDVHALRVAAPR